MGWFRSVNKNGTEYKPVGNVITATSLSVTGPALAAGDVVRVMFTTDIAGSDTSTPLALTWNSGVTPIPVKVAKEGSLASVYAKEVATNIFKYISGYVTLELAFDGTNLVIVGNPVVLSGAGYTIYADGSNGQQWFPDYAGGNLITGDTNTYTCTEDCYCVYTFVTSGSTNNLYVNGNAVSKGGPLSGGAVSSFNGYLKNGDVLTFDRTVSTVNLGIFGLT